jgi:ubiquinol-cytochrome c reductase cytochrome b subunit|tara:strand:+ start:40018 stop:41172 length:1155 start_codon:yes stop_codon:yes gene_type:complete
MLVLSGWAMAGSYVPSDSEAFSSILYMRKAAGWGQLLRSIHHFISSALVISGFLYFLGLFVSGEYKTRHCVWISGLAAYFVILGSCFTGYLFPMDQNAFWGTTVRLGIVESIPIIGTPIADILRGGALFNAATLPRFYTLHVSILPVVFLVLIWIVIRNYGFDVRKTPKQSWMLIAGILTVVVIYFVAVSTFAPLEPQADPTDVNYDPRPEWYFLWLFQFGKYVENLPWIRSLVLPFLGVGFLFSLPRLKEQKLSQRAAIAGVWCVVWLGLTGLALYDDRNLPDKLNYEAAMVVEAGENYNDLCVQCHGKSGKGDGSEARLWGYEPPDLTSDDFWKTRTESQLKTSILEGKGSDMESFKKKLTPDNIDFMIEYFKQSFRPNSGS